MLGFLLAAALLAAMPQAPIAVPMRVVNNHVVVEVMLDGAGPFRFIVDSGAGNLLDPAVAATIGARTSGHVRLVGVGNGRQTGTFTTIGRVNIGASTFTDQGFVVAPTRSTFGAIEGPVVDGLIGRAIIGSGVTVFDYAQQTLTFGATDDEFARDGTTVLPLTTIDGEPHVPCVVGGVAGSCALDTGSRLNVTIPAPFAEQHPEIAPQTTTAVGVEGFGIGGAAYGRLGRLASLALGSLTFTDVVADFSVQRDGAFASRRMAANIGGGLLRRLTLVFDLARGRVGLRANHDRTAFDSNDRSGLFLTTRGGTIAVLDVRPQTPAARAGIAAGDRIISAGGQTFVAQTLPDLRLLLAGPPATRVSLVVARGGATPRTIDLELDDYV